MSEAGYKKLISYKLSDIAFQLGWEMVSHYYPEYEDRRQRDQIKQALRSCKQNIVEGSSSRSITSKLMLYNVAKASGMEALEDFEDYLKIHRLPKWKKNDPRLKKLQYELEYKSNPSPPSSPSIVSAMDLDEADYSQKIEIMETTANYLIDVLIRCGYLLDRQIDAVENKHQREGGYREKLHQNRLNYRNS